MLLLAFLSTAIIVAAQEYALVRGTTSPTAHTVLPAIATSSPPSQSEAKELAASRDALGIDAFVERSSARRRALDEAMEKVEPTGYDLFGRVAYDSRLVQTGSESGIDVCDVWFFRTRAKDFGAGLHIEATYPIQPSGIAREEYTAGVSMGWGFRNFTDILGVPLKYLTGL